MSVKLSGGDPLGVQSSMTEYDFIYLFIYLDFFGEF